MCWADVGSTKLIIVSYGIHSTEWLLLLVSCHCLLMLFIPIVTPLLQILLRKAAALPFAVHSVTITFPTAIEYRSMIQLFGILFELVLYFKITQCTFKRTF